MAVTSLKKPQMGNGRAPSFLKWQEIIVLALDTSTSMGNEFRMPSFRVMTRLEALKEAAGFYMGQKAAASQRTATCVVGFARTAQVLAEWTTLADLSRVLAAISVLRTTDPATNVAGALEMGLDRIREFPTHPLTWRQPKVLLVTDGAGNVRRDDQEEMLQRAQAERVKVFTIAICNQRDDPKTYDRDYLFRVARDTGGRFTNAQSLDQLKEALANAR